jgi:hypothetical protein
MRKAGIIFVLLMFFQILLYAQENDSEEEPDIEPDWSDVYTQDLYSRGDQVFIISLGAAFPTVFTGKGEIIQHNFYPPVGWAGSLSYCYFLTPNIFLGGELGGKVLPTLGNNMVFIIPVGVRAGYQFLLWRLEFPLNVSVGMAWHRLLDMTYYGFYVKGGGSAFFRFNPDWSFGLSSNWYWFPEWVKDKTKNIDGNFVDLTLSVRYHF